MHYGLVIKKAHLAYLSAKPRPLSKTKELITRVAYVGPLQVEEFKYYRATNWKNLSLSNQKKGELNPKVFCEELLQLF